MAWHVLCFTSSGRRFDVRRRHREVASARPPRARDQKELEMNPYILSVSLAIGGLAAGCSSNVPPPNDQWSAAQVDVGRAQAGGAPSVPDAKLHLQLAEEDLQKSKALIGSDNKHAATLIALASTEAQLASTLAQAARARAEAQQAEDVLQKGGAQ
jgi:hypothetical protein